MSLRIGVTRMAVNWKYYHVKCSPSGNKVFIQRRGGSDPKVEQSEDRTDEVVLAIMEKMLAQIEKKNNPKKPWFGYRFPGLGQLIFIKGDHHFKVTR